MEACKNEIEGFIDHTAGLRGTVSHSEVINLIRTWIKSVTVRFKSQVPLNILKFLSPASPGPKVLLALPAVPLAASTSPATSASPKNSWA